MVRLKDIAERAGVSMMTVSKALRNAPDVSASTRERIRRLAATMGYVPDSGARGLRRRSTRLLGVVLPSVSHPVFSEVVESLEEAAATAGFDVVLAQGGLDPDREDAAIRRVLSRRVDGIFVAPVYRLSTVAPIYSELEKRSVPTVLLAPPAGFCRQFPGVVSADEEGMADLVGRLLDLGHREIALLSGGPVSPPARERLSGYRRALRERNVPFREANVFSGGISVEDGRRAAALLADEKPSVTAVVAVNDWVALGAMEILSERGIRIPEDVSIAGFGDLPGSAWGRVPLTTVRPARRLQGDEAVGMMMRLLKGDPVSTRRLPPQVVERRSTTVPGAGLGATSSG